MSTNRGGLMVAKLFAFLGADTTEFEKQMRKTVSNLLFVGESFSQVGRIMTTFVSAPLAAVGIAAIKMAMDFDRSMMKIQTLVGVQREQLDAWRGDILDIAQVTGRSANEMADALFFITSNGHKAETAMTVLHEAAMAAAVGLGETKDIAFAATSAINAYGQGSMTAAEAVSVLVRTVREGNLEASELAPVLGQILPIAAAYGVEFTEAGAAVATMTRSGTSARLAALGLKSAMISIFAPTQRARDAFEGAEINLGELQATASNKSFLDALLMMVEATENSSVTLRDMLPNAKAYNAVLQLVGKNVEETIKIHEELSKTVGTDTADAFKETAKGPAASYDRAMANLNVSAIKLGQNLYHLVEKLEEATSGVAGMAEKFNQADDGTKGLIIGMGQALVVVGPLLYGVGQLFRVIARFTGLSIIFQAAWVKKVAAMMAAKGAAIATATSFDLLGVSVGKAAAGIVTAGLAGWEFGKALDKWFKVTEGYNKIFGDVGTLQEQLAKSFKKNNDAMFESVSNHAFLAQKIGNVKLAQDLVNAAVAKNYDLVAELTIKVEEEAAAYNDLNRKIEGLSQAEWEAKKAAEARLEIEKEARAEEDARLAGLREEHDLMNKGDIEEALRRMTTEMKGHVDSGVLMKDVLNEYKDDFIKLITKAKEYNAVLPQGITEFSNAFAEKGVIPFMKIGELMYGLKTDMKNLPGEVIPGMVKIGDEIATSLEGGTLRGLERSQKEIVTFGEGVSATLKGAVQYGVKDVGTDMGNALQTWIAEHEPVAIKVKPDENYWDAAWAEVMEGNRPTP